MCGALLLEVLENLKAAKCLNRVGIGLHIIGYVKHV
ncbi:hypothetical protein PbB2_02234 [Candidatus Phycosocius bacilliformis]|uniref:Uncharacterized protein n=1 Tax=Candidatus Phycosocius bacilliformis TaxID=1445552 RepID=A0A2P2EBW8_9PROT|nr:hypothetical protein PbB2_02234 [Candidatus Phycosocius bacilliformis]